MVCDVLFDVEAVREMLLARGRACILAAAEYCLEKAQGYCPVDSGDLKKSGHLLPDDDPNKIWVAFTEYYAAFVEFGHYTVNQKSWVMPQPFLRYGVADAVIQFPSVVTAAWASTVPKGESGEHYYASRFAYSRPEFESQYTSLGFPEPGPSE